MQTKGSFSYFSSLCIESLRGIAKNTKTIKSRALTSLRSPGREQNIKNAIKEKFSSKLIFIFLQWKFLIKTKLFWRKDHKTTKRRSRCLCVSISCIRCSKFFMKLLSVSLCALTLMTTKTTIQHLLHYIIKVKNKSRKPDLRHKRPFVVNPTNAFKRSLKVKRKSIIVHAF